MLLRRWAHRWVCLATFFGCAPWIESLSKDPIRRPPSMPTVENEGPSSKLLILGLGRVGLECGRLALPVFDRVVGTVRSLPSSLESLPEEPIEKILFDPPLQSSASGESQLEDHLKDATHILWTIPLVRDDEAMDAAVDLLRTNSNTAQWLGLVSTSGVYGNHDGAWVTEESLPRCTPESNADLYRAMEEAFADLGGQIFRCAGIYDATFSALHTVYRSGRPREEGGTAARGLPSVTNRIHSADIARAIVSSMEAATPGGQESRIFNLSDDRPAPRAEVLSYAADLLETHGITLPEPDAGVSPADSWRPSKREMRRRTDRKLVSNQRMKEELLQPLEGKSVGDHAIDHPLQYPTYKEGLEAILRTPGTPWYDHLHSVPLHDADAAS